MGDPAGVSAELATKLLALPEVRARASSSSGTPASWKKVRGSPERRPTCAWSPTRTQPPRSVRARPRRDLRNLAPEEVETAKATHEGGRSATENFRRAVLAAKAQRADAVFFTPFNKAAMRMAYPAYDDEIRFVKNVLGEEYLASEFNVLDRLWNARVTSHVPLSEVAARITLERLDRALRLADACMRSAGFERPRLGVAALNPHAGDGGNFGREEIDVIAPAVERAQAAGIAAEGPFPSDTVFLRARAGQFDAVLTMYHNQGQIAMKLMGFERGVTMLGGYPFPICTPAHGTAYDIAGRGVTNVGAAREALLLAIRMAERAASAPARERVSA
jgi:4-hydroxythreonine-4-phosphate dehydrogenase